MANERYTAQQVIQAIHDTRGLVSYAAQRLNCDPDTVRNYARRHPTVAAALKEERERVTDIAELALFTKIQEGEAWAICFYLKTQGKDRGYVERQENLNRGDPDSPIQHRHIWDVDSGRLAEAALKLEELRSVRNGHGNGIPEASS